MNVYKYSKAVRGHTRSPELGCQFQNSKNVGNISINMPVTGDGGLHFVEQVELWPRVVVVVV